MKSWINMTYEVTTNASRFAFVSVTVDVKGAQYELRHPRGRQATIKVKDGKASGEIKDIVIVKSEGAPDFKISLLEDSAVVDVNAIVSGLPSDNPLFAITRLVVESTHAGKIDCAYRPDTGKLVSCQKEERRPVKRKAATTQPERRQVFANVSISGKTSATDVEWCDGVSFKPSSPKADWSELYVEPAEGEASMGVHGGIAHITLEHAKFLVWEKGGTDALAKDAEDCVDMLKDALIGEIHAELSGDSEGYDTLEDVGVAIRISDEAISIRGDLVPVLPD